MTQTWKRAIIVGASSGIGEALARALASTGCRIALVARREDRLRALAQEFNAQADAVQAMTYAHDVTDIGSVPGLFETITRELGG